MRITIGERLRRHYRSLLLVLLIATGLVLHQLGVFDWHRVLAIGEGYAHRWWFPVAVIVTKGLLYAFALPGSILFWLPGLFYHPLVAAAMLAVGGVAGALAAYMLARPGAVEVDVDSRSGRFFGFLRTHSDFFSLTAIRALPGFPHSVINYGCGLLRVPRSRFLLATAVGFWVKGYVYSAAVRQAATAEDAADIASAEAVLPLLALALLFAAGRLFMRKKIPGE